MCVCVVVCSVCACLYVVCVGGFVWCVWVCVGVCVSVCSILHK